MVRAAAFLPLYICDSHSTGFRRNPASRATTKQFRMDPVCRCAATTQFRSIWEGRPRARDCRGGGAVGVTSVTRAENTVVFFSLRRATRPFAIRHCERYLIVIDYRQVFSSYCGPAAAAAMEVLPGPSSGNFPRHPDRTRGGFGEAELLVEAICRDVGYQTDIGGLWQLLLDIVRQRGHDHLAEPPALMGGHERDICDLKEAASVADDATHADDRVAMHQTDAKDRIGQAFFSRLS